MGTDGVAKPGVKHLWISIAFQTCIVAHQCTGKPILSHWFWVHQSHSLNRKGLPSNGGGVCWGELY